MEHVRFGIASIVLAVAFFAGMVVFIEVGRELGARRAAKLGEASKDGLGRVETAVYAVLSLLLGFTFGGAAARFDHRREIVVDQVVAVGDVLQYTDMLPHQEGADIRRALDRYLDQLLATHARPPGTELEAQERKTLDRAESDLWNKAVAATRADTGEKARMLLMPSVDALFDAVNEDRLAQRIHPPLMIWAMIAVAATFAGLFAGFSMAGPTRNWFHVIGTAATISITIFVILELESPRLGLIRMDSMDEALAELRETMK
jgi:hypothetical protein